jgi:hypothetical protein
MFVMVSFLALALMAFHPLAKEAGKESGYYISDRNFQRHRQALFGAAVDQCPTVLTHCSGVFGDYPEIGGKARAKVRWHRFIWSRIFGYVRDTKSGDRGDIEPPQTYQFSEDHFWSGYRGKRYLYLIPSDHWNGDAYIDDWPDGFTNYHPFWGPYYQLTFGGVCGNGASGIDYSNAADFAEIKDRKINVKLGATDKVSVELKDFSTDRNFHNLRLVLTGSKNGRSSEGNNDNMYFELASGHPKIRMDHRLYLFEQDLGGGSTNLERDTGQKKLMIQVQEYSGAPWVTRDTRVIVLSPWDNKGSEPLFQANFYG